MEPLIKRRCRPCEGGMPPLEQKFIDEYLESIPLWRQEGIEIKRDFTFPDFKTALSFVDEIGELAEQEGHHPDVTLSWGKVGVSLSTHAIEGLSENDFILAAKIDTMKKQL